VTDYSELGLGSDFDSNTSKLETMVGTVENWSCVVFDQISRKKRGARGHENSRILQK